MKRLQHLLMSGLLLLSMAGMMAVAVPTPAAAAVNCDKRLLGIPPWYRGLTDKNNNCEITQPEQKSGGLSKFIWTIALNVIEMLLVVVGYVSVAFIIVGGFSYMTAAGSPDGMKNAKDTIRNAIIGLVIALASVAIVNAIAEAL